MLNIIHYQVFDVFFLTLAHLIFYFKSDLMDIFAFLHSYKVEYAPKIGGFPGQI